MTLSLAALLAIECQKDDQQGLVFYNERMTGRPLFYGNPGVFSIHPTEYGLEHPNHKNLSQVAGYLFFRDFVWRKPGFKSDFSSMLDEAFCCMKTKHVDGMMMYDFLGRDGYMQRAATLSLDTLELDFYQTGGPSSVSPDSPVVLARVAAVRESSMQIRFAAGTHMVMDGKDDARPIMIGRALSDTAIKAIRAVRDDDWQTLSDCLPELGMGHALNSDLLLPESPSLLIDALVSLDMDGPEAVKEWVSRASRPGRDTGGA